MLIEIMHSFDISFWKIPKKHIPTGQGEYLIKLQNYGFRNGVDICWLMTTG